MTMVEQVETSKIPVIDHWIFSTPTNYCCATHTNHLCKTYTFYRVRLSLQLLNGSVEKGLFNDPYESHR